MMDWRTRVKLGLLVAAGIFFFGSVKLQQDWLRYVAIGLLIVALVVRIVKPGSPRRGPLDKG